MILYLSAFCYVTFFVLALVSPFMPLFLMWRIAALSGVAFVLGQLIEGPIHWSDQNVGHAIGMAILSLFCIGIGVLLIIRLILAAASKKLNLKTIIGSDSNVKNWFDIAILAAMGCLVGLWFTIVLSKFLSGASIGEKLDIGPMGT